MVNCRQQLPYRGKCWPDKANLDASQETDNKPESEKSGSHDRWNSRYLRQSVERQIAVLPILDVGHVQSFRQPHLQSFLGTIADASMTASD
jgi:hypothetical protein